MQQISKEKLKNYRDRTFRITSQLRVTNPRGALEFVDERGLIFFWPVKGIILPSLWIAAAGDRPVPDEHDDPGHKTWDWKDKALGKRIWYYAKLLRRRATFISLDAAPYFYALTPNYGEPEQDYLLQYQEGQLTVESKQVYEALLREGPLDTISLKKEAHLSSSGSETRFNKALDDLQMEMKILPVGVAEVGSWNYAFIYDLTHRHFPDLIQDSRSIQESAACLHLVDLYLNSLGALNSEQISRLFRWDQPRVDRVVSKLQKDTKALEAAHPDQPGLWFALPEVLE
jgi:hypothetical protein